MSFKDSNIHAFNSKEVLCARWYI